MVTKYDLPFLSHFGNRTLLSQRTLDPIRAALARGLSPDPYAVIDDVRVTALKWREDPDRAEMIRAVFERMTTENPQALAWVNATIAMERGGPVDKPNLGPATEKQKAYLRALGQPEADMPASVEEAGMMIDARRSGKTLDRAFIDALRDCRRANAEALFALPTRPQWPIEVPIDTRHYPNQNLLTIDGCLEPSHDPERRRLLCPVCSDAYCFETQLADSDAWYRRGSEWLDRNETTLSFACEGTGHQFAYQFGFWKGETWFRILVGPNAPEEADLSYPEFEEATP